MNLLENQFRYDALIEMGFKRDDVYDKNFFNKNGYNYFILALNIGVYAFEYDLETHKITLFKYSIKFKEIESAEELKYLIELLK